MAMQRLADYGQRTIQDDCGRRRTAMARTTLTGPRGTLDVQREMTPVHYVSDLDANWRFTDAAGHPHRCEYDAADNYPTLLLVVEETYWCETCCDEHQAVHRECRQCGETVTPGTTGPGTRYIAGLTTYTFNGEEITPEKAQEIIAEWRAGG
jgi:hypothetical protein